MSDMAYLYLFVATCEAILAYDKSDALDRAALPKSILVGLLWPAIDLWWLTKRLLRGK